MGRRATILELAFLLAVLLALAGMAACHVWWRTSPYATVVPQQTADTAVIETTASVEILNAAVFEATSRYQNYIVQPNGTKSDPTYAASSRHFRRGEGNPVEGLVTSETVESHIEFRDRGGRLVQIDKKRATNQPTRITVTYQPPGDAATLTEEILRGLSQRGVSVR